MAILVEFTKPFKVRASCGHIVIRRMREATAGVPYTEDTVLDAARGRACDDCEAKATVTITYRNAKWTTRDYECTNVVACVGLSAPGPNWVECDPAILEGLTPLWIEHGVKYWGYL